MYEVGAILIGLQQTLGHHLEYVLETARTCPPSGSAKWTEVMERYQVTPADVPDRTARISNHKNAQGALPKDVRKVLKAVVGMASASLGQIHSQMGGALQADAGLAGQAQGLGSRLEGLVKQKVQDYKERIKPEASGSVSSIFANATETAKMTPWADMKWDRNMTLSCVGCGAPQDNPLDFQCSHCGGHLVGKEE